MRRKWGSARRRSSTRSRASLAKDWSCIGAGLGPFVAEPTVDEILELYDCRLMCELHAVREGFTHIDHQFIVELGRHLDRHEAVWALGDETFESQRR